MSFNVCENGHLVTLFGPADMSTAASSEVLSLENWAHASIVISKGVGSAVTITLESCTAFAGTGWATMDFKYAIEDTASGDTLGVLTAATTAGIAIDADTDTLLVIEVDSAELPTASPYLRIKHDAATSSIFAAVAVLSGGRYQSAQTATAIV